MTRTADVVVIGAGVMGASAAYHLAACGCRSVLVLEQRGRAGLGSTGKAMGGFRGQFATEVCVRLSLLAREKLLRFHDELGVDPGYRPVGYLFMARTPGQLETLRAAQTVQRRAGLDAVREVTPDDIRRLSPAVVSDRFIGGAFCPTDGYIAPLEILRGYLAGAERLGVAVEYGAGEVTCLVDESDGGVRRMRGVNTRRGEVAARRVVNAAGPWAAAVARTAGVEIPVVPTRRQVAISHPCSLPADTPMTIDVDDGVHYRVRDGRVVWMWPVDTPADDPFDTTFDPRWLGALLPRAYALAPGLRDAGIDPNACLCGLYEMSPDKHAILGPAPGVEGLYLINGSSGHGVMHSAALGQLLAEIIVDGHARSVDVRALRASRFVEGEPNFETGVL